MPQLVGLVLIGAGVWAGYKAIQRWSRRVTDAQPQTDVVPITSERDLGALHLDPETGVYKPAPR